MKSVRAAMIGVVAWSLACGGLAEEPAAPVPTAPVATAPVDAPAPPAPSAGAPAPSKGTPWWVGTWTADEIVGDVTGMTYLILAKADGQANLVLVTTSGGERSSQQMTARIQADDKVATFLCEGKCLSPSGNPVKNGAALIKLWKRKSRVDTEWMQFLPTEPTLQLFSRAQSDQFDAPKQLPQGECCCMNTVDDAWVELGASSEAACWDGHGCLPRTYEGLCREGA